MNINVRGHEVELFETERDWKNYLKDYKNESYIYSGELLTVTENIWKGAMGFQNLTDLIQSVNKQNFSHTEYVIIK